MRGSFPKTVSYGECSCGCGQKTKIIQVNNAPMGLIKGEPRRFIRGHHLKPKYGKDNYFSKNIFSGKDNPMYGKTGKDSPNWKGGKFIAKYKHTSYVKILMPEHHRSNHLGYVLEHILVAEKALGEPLPEGAVVHHIDSNGLNNNNNNLVVCQDHAYHMTLHKRGENGKWMKMN